MNGTFSMEGKQQEVNRFVQIFQSFIRFAHCKRARLMTSRDTSHLEVELEELEVPKMKKRGSNIVQLKLITGESVELILSDVKQFDMANGHILLTGKTYDLPPSSNLLELPSSEAMVWKQ